MKQTNKHFVVAAHHISQPPDVTNNAKSTRQADRVGRYNPSSVRVTASGIATGLGGDDGMGACTILCVAFFLDFSSPRSSLKLLLSLTMLHPVQFGSVADFLLFLCASHSPKHGMGGGGKAVFLFLLSMWVSIVTMLD